jgi:hypothetical protein
MGASSTRMDPFDRNMQAATLENAPVQPIRQVNLFGL